MVRVPSQMIELGSEAPDFSLPDPDGVMHALDDASGAKGIVVAFLSNHCPFVKHLADEFAAFSREFIAQGGAVFAIMSNDIEGYPDDAPPRMAEESILRGYAFPYLHDAEQSVAKAYGATCTPDFFLYGPDRRLVYRGQFDDSRPNSGTADGADLRAAAEALLAGDTPTDNQKPSVGCNIKWRSGNEPEYARS